jgi:hypothetical protein
MKTENDNNDYKLNSQCYHCGGYGHFARDCTSNINNVSTGAKDDMDTLTAKNTEANKSKVHPRRGRVNRGRGGFKPFKPTQKTVRFAENNHITGDIPTAVKDYKNERRYIYFKPENQTNIYECFIDTGADFEVISMNTVKELGLTIIPPPNTELTHIRLADKSKVKRIGYVVLNGTLIFPDEEPYQTPINIQKKFEVMECEHSFILGTGLLPTIFQHDNIMNYVTPHSSITDKPTVYYINGDDNKNNDNNNDRKTTSSSYISNIPSYFDSNQTIQVSFASMNMITGVSLSDNDKNNNIMNIDTDLSSSSNGNTSSTSSNQHE